MRRILLTGLPLLLLVAPFLSIWKYQIYPQKEPMAIDTFSDATLGGHSQIIDLRQNPRNITFNFRLNQGYPSPYAGMILKPEKKPVDISFYDSIILKVKSNIDRVRVDLHFQPPRSELLIKSANSIVTESWIETQDLTDEYTIKLRDFKIPHWWYSFYGIDHLVDDKVDHRFLSFLEITASDVTINGMDKEIILEHIEFSKSPFPFLIMVLVVLAVYYSIAFFYSLRKKRQQKSPIPLNKLASTNMNDQDVLDAEKIIRYIHNYYKNPDFCLDDLINETGISSKRINQLLKQNQKTTFIKYIHTLRLDLSKELLRDTNQSITKIAYECGFNNHTHFHRFFKEKEGVSPGEFRKQKNK